MTLVEFLRQRLAAQLPGWSAQVAMAPRIPRLQEPLPSHAASCRKSAVLVLLAEEQPNEHDILFTVRSRSLSHHSGQISFPGGRIEPGETIVDAAVREACEEVRLHVPSLQQLGMLTPLYVPVSNNLMYPVVAHVQERPWVDANPEEVDEVFFAPLSLLTSGEHLREEEWTLGGRAVRVPYWSIHSVPLWGATAMILSELVALYKEFGNQ